MAERLNSGLALDVNLIGVELNDGTFKLFGYMDDVDYCDPEREIWVETIGVHKVTGEYRAAFDGRFISNPMYHLLWIRTCALM